MLCLKQTNKSEHSVLYINVEREPTVLIWLTHSNVFLPNVWSKDHNDEFSLTFGKVTILFNFYFQVIQVYDYVINRKKYGEKNNFASEITLSKLNKKII